MTRRSTPPLSPAAEALFAEERVIAAADEAMKQRALLRAREAVSGDRLSGIVIRPSRAWWLRKGPVLPLAAASPATPNTAAAGAQIYRARTSESELTRAYQAPRQVVSEPRLAPQAPPPETAKPVPTPEPAPVGAVDPKATTARQSTAKAAGPSSAESYAIELGLLEPARTAVGQGNFASALASIAKHQQHFPRGQLSEEREALRVRALWGTGQTGRARSAAAAFRKSYPKSGLLSWMKDTATPEP